MQDLFLIAGTFIAGWLIFLLIQRSFFPSRAGDKSKFLKKQVFDDDNDADNEEETTDADGGSESDGSETDDSEGEAAAARGLLDRIRPAPPAFAPPPPPAWLLGAQSPTDELLLICQATNKALDEITRPLAEYLESSSAPVAERWGVFTSAA